MIKTSENLSFDNLKNYSRDKYKLNDFIPIYGTWNYFRRNSEETLTSTKVGLKDAALFFYNIALVLVSVSGLEKLLQ